MAILNELGKKISNLAQSTVRKTKEVGDMTKLTVSISEEEGKLKKIYTEIGREYFETMAMNSRGHLAELCDNALEVYQKLDKMRTQLAEARKLVVCTVCGSQNPQGYSFCPVCGAELVSEPVSPEEADASTAAVQEAYAMEKNGQEGEAETEETEKPAE